MKEIQPLRQYQAAELAGITVQGLQKCDHGEDPPPRSPNGYPCRDFGEWLKRRHLRGLGVTDDGQVYDFNAERARLTHHQANKTALEEQLLEGKVIHAEEVDRVWSGMIASFRAKCLSIPTKAAQAVITTADIAEAESILTDAIHEALAELADYDASQYNGAGSGAQGRKTDSTAAETDGEPVGGRGKTAVKRGKRGTRPVEH